MKKLLILVAISSLALLASGCSDGQGEMTNSEIISTTKQCEDAGLGIKINYWSVDEKNEIYNIQCQPK